MEHDWKTPVTGKTSGGYPSESIDENHDSHCNIIVHVVPVVCVSRFCDRSAQLCTLRSVTHAGINDIELQSISIIFGHYFGKCIANVKANSSECLLVSDMEHSKFMSMERNKLRFLLLMNNWSSLSLSAVRSPLLNIDLPQSFKTTGG